MPSILIFLHWFGLFWPFFELSEKEEEEEVTNLPLLELSALPQVKRS